MVITLCRGHWLAGLGSRSRNYPAAMSIYTLSDISERMSPAANWHYGKFVAMELDAPPELLVSNPSERKAVAASV